MMQPKKQLVDQLFLARVRAARAMKPEDKLLSRRSTV
jgi:hypothetical protein